MQSGLEAGSRFEPVGQGETRLAPCILLASGPGPHPGFVKVRFGAGPEACRRKLGSPLSAGSGHPGPLARLLKEWPPPFPIVGFGSSSDYAAPAS